MSGHTGELFALITALCWTASSQFFESATRRIGSLAVNLLRLPLALLLLCLFNLFHRGLFLPVDAGSRAWLWLLLSGFLGFSVGDLFLFKAYMLIGARVALLLQTLVPPLAALLSLLFLGEAMAARSLLGMAVTLAGVALVILTSEMEEGSAALRPKRAVRFSYSAAGLLLALGAAVGSAAGQVLSKLGMGTYDAFAATQIRLIAGISGFLLIFTLRGRWRNLGTALKNSRALASLSAGAVFGPFLGVSFSLLALQRTGVGIASTLMYLSPVLIIPAAIIFRKERVKLKEILGALLAVAGALLFFL